jgi:hypothetical protein
MGITINGIQNEKDAQFNITEQDIRNTVVKMPKRIYSARASLETWYGSVEITGWTLHNIFQQCLVQNKEFRKLVKLFIDELDDGKEHLYTCKKY